jgi:hypothetical protein
MRGFLLIGAAVIVAVTGVALTLLGRPFGVALQTVHKLVALAGVVYLGVVVYEASRAAPLPTPAVAAVVVAAVLALASFASGGVVSGLGSAPEWVVTAHRLATWVMLGVAAVAGYLVTTLA